MKLSQQSLELKGKKLFRNTVHISLSEVTSESLTSFQLAADIYVFCLLYILTFRWTLDGFRYLGHYKKSYDLTNRVRRLIMARWLSARRAHVNLMRHSVYMS